MNVFIVFKANSLLV